MNICVETSSISYALHRGIGNYSTSLLKKMLDIDHTNQYFILHCYDVERDFSFLEKYENVTLIKCSVGKPTLDKENVHHIDTVKYYKDIYKDLFNKIIAQYKIDVFYITAPDSFSIFEKSWFGNAKVVATLYDIIPALMPRQYGLNKKTENEYKAHLKSMAIFDKLFAISQSAKDDFVSVTKCDPKKIDVIGGAPDEKFIHKIVPNDRQSELKEKFKIDKDFIICTGGDDFRKNIDNLIISFLHIDKKYLEKYQLVIVCKIREEQIKYYLDIANKNNNKNNIVFTNFVTDEELIDLMNMAKASVFPSKYEGFGLPVVEAYAVNIPNLTSNNSSLGEIASGSSILVDPFNIKSITQGINELLDENNWPSLIESGKKKLEKYNWENVARITLNGINSLAIDKKKENRHIAIFSPLPPIESGISDYIVDVINNLKSDYEIDVFIDDGYKANHIEGVNIFNHKKYKKLHKKYKTTIYEIGSSTYHIYMYQYLMKYKGIIELHDGNYENVFSYCYAKRLLPPKVLRDIYAKERIDNVLNSDDSESKSINFFIMNATSVIVHSDYLRRIVLRQHLCKSITIPHYSIDNKLDKYECRKDLNLKQDDFIFLSTGFIHPNKRIDKIIRAFIKINKEYDNAKLILAGECFDNYKKEIFDLIDQNNLKDKVMITGFIKDINSFDKYSKASDVILALRHPYNGESSGSISRALGLEKPIIVNRIGAFDEIDNDAIIKIDRVEKLDDEVDAIYQIMKKCLDGDIDLNKISENAKKYVDNNLRLNIIKDKYKAILNDERIISLNNKIFLNLKNNDLKNDKYNEKELKKFLSTLAYILKV